MLSKAGLGHLARHLNSSSQVVMRADFNVPIYDGKVADANRIKATIPTIEEILSHNPKSLVLLSHLGSPNSKRKHGYSLRPVFDELSTYLNRKITFLDDCVGEDVISKVNQASNEVFLCENVRFHIEEVGLQLFDKGKDKKIASPEKVKAFRDQLSQLGSVFVNDAFGTAHRAHSSIIGINHKFRVAGRLMEKQLSYLGKFLQKPKKPVVVVLGGAKVSDKINLIKNMIHFADEIIIGGGMKNPFLTEIFGRNIGATYNILPQNPKLLLNIMALAKQKNCKLHFPVDYRVALSSQKKTGQGVRIMKFEDTIPNDSEIFDIGPQTGKNYGEVIEKAGSIFWNGPMGVFEVPEFRKGSEDVLQSMIRSTEKGAVSIIGGGDSASMVKKLNCSQKVSYVSTGGGATIQILEGKILPGVSNLSEISDLE